MGAETPKRPAEQEQKLKAISALSGYIIHDRWGKIHIRPQVFSASKIVNHDGFFSPNIPKLTNIAKRIPQPDVGFLTSQFYSFLKEGKKVITIFPSHHKHIRKIRNAEASSHGIRVNSMGKPKCPLLGAGPISKEWSSLAGLDYAV